MVFRCFLPALFLISTCCINVWTESGCLQSLEGDVVEVPPASDKSHPVKRFGSTDVSPRHRCATARHHPKSMWPQTHPSLTTDIWQNALHGRTETTDWTDMQLQATALLLLLLLLLLLPPFATCFGRPAAPGTDLRRNDARRRTTAVRRATDA